MLKEKVLKLLNDIEMLKDKNLEECKLPENTYYLNDTDILCLERTEGVSRYPYEMDGLNLWALSNGHINVNESNLIIFRTAYLADFPSLEFWGGVRNDKEWFPISITGSTKQLYEPVEVSRYTVYSKRAAYYIADTLKYTFTLRVSVTSEKDILFAVSAINKVDDGAELYVTSYIDPVLRFTNNDNEWAPLKRIGIYHDNGVHEIIRHSNPGDNDLTNYAVINKSIVCENNYCVDSTVSKNVFLGDLGKTIFNAKTLKTGGFTKEKYIANTTDMALASDIIKFNLSKSEEFNVYYLLKVVHSEEAAKELISRTVDVVNLENDLREQEFIETKKMSGLDIKFDKLKDTELNNVVFNKFIGNLKKQISLCALGKNYSGDLLGVRDVFQQLNAATVWNRKDARKQIVMALNFLMENGRAPRQFSVPARADIIPKFDIRQFLDQGLWIIETLHKYLSYTEDYSILEEKCSYYEIIDEKRELYKKSDCIDTVLDHLIKVTNYLVSNIDERTNCLKILYGDWNDAVCGLGVPKDKSKEFGTGVSVMATLQLYKLLNEMNEILSKVGGYSEKCGELIEVREKIAQGLLKFSIQKDGTRRHIIHGWGDEGSYNVGSLEDTDGKCRYSVNPYSFWCISELIKRDSTFKEDVLKAYDVLDSKYGIKTFEPYFPADMQGVGRIATLTPGTAENSCAYIHATMFAVMALFIIGEPERAWEQMFKAMPITHKFVSKTPFVMPNQYCHNDEYDIDGESLGDWYTGSGAVLLRCIFEYALGIQPDLEGLKIYVPSYIPSDSVHMNVTIKNSDIEYIYKNNNSGKRIYVVNGVEQETVKDFVSGNEVLYIENSKLNDKMLIEIFD